MKNILRIGLIVLLVFLLIIVRSYASNLFYDPFSEFFKNNYLKLTFPQFLYGKLFVSLVLRFFLNSFISLLIIYLFFLKKSTITFAIKFYLVAFVVLIVSFFVLLNTTSSSHLLIFYIRRMLVHPLLLLILLPSFYYQKKILNH